MIYSYTGRLYNNENEHISVIHKINFKNSTKYKSQVDKYILCDSTYIRIKSRSKDSIA